MKFTWVVLIAIAFGVWLTLRTRSAPDRSPTSVPVDAGATEKRTSTATTYVHRPRTRGLPPRLSRASDNAWDPRVIRSPRTGEMAELQESRMLFVRQYDDFVRVTNIAPEREVQIRRIMADVQANEHAWNRYWQDDMPEEDKAAMGVLYYQQVANARESIHALLTPEEWATYHEMLEKKAGWYYLVGQIEVFAW